MLEFVAPVQGSARQWIPPSRTLCVAATLKIHHALPSGTVVTHNADLPEPRKDTDGDRATTIRRQWWSSDEPMRIVADRHGVNISTVWRIIHRQLHADGPRVEGELFVDGRPTRRRPTAAKRKGRRPKTYSALPVPAESPWPAPVLDLSFALREALLICQQHGAEVERQPDLRFRIRLGDKRYHLGPVDLSPNQARRLLRAGMESPVIFAAAYPETGPRTAIQH